MPFAVTPADRARLVRGLVPAAVVMVLDQITKLVMVGAVMQPSRVIEVTPFFNLVMTWNRGVSFGMFNTGSPWNAWVLTAVALVICAALVAWLRKAEGRWVPLALGLVIGGALGNVIDRLHWGAVADFLDFHAFGYHWPAFNLADSAITVGAAALVLDSLFAGPEKPKLPPEGADSKDSA
ncbi:MAG: signal peptidase II [Magnetospirillum sp. WYHS-4]